METLLLGTVSCIVDPETLETTQRSQGGLCSWLWLCQGG